LDGREIPDPTKNAIDLTGIVSAGVQELATPLTEASFETRVEVYIAGYSSEDC
jgi:hypothetical protein